MTKTFHLYLLLIFLIISWSLNTIFTKIGLHYMPPIWLVAARFLIGTIIAFVLLGCMKRLKLPKRKDLPFIFSIGLIQMGLFQTFFNYGMMFVHAGRASILTYSTPIWVAPIAILFFGEKVTPLKLLGILLGIAGILVLFSPNSFDWHDRHVLIGNGMLVLSSLCWAGVMLHTRYGKWHSEPLELLPWQLAVGCIVPLILAPIFEPVDLIQWAKPLWGVMLFSGVIATALGYWISIMVSKQLPVITTSLSLLSVPVLTLFFSDLMLNEPLTASNLVAVSSIILGLVCISLPGKKLKAIK